MGRGRGRTRVEETKISTLITIIRAQIKGPKSVKWYKNRYTLIMKKNRCLIMKKPANGSPTHDLSLDPSEVDRGREYHSNTNSKDKSTSSNYSL